MSRRGRDHVLCGYHCVFDFFFNDTATTEIYTLSLHDALPILLKVKFIQPDGSEQVVDTDTGLTLRSEEHTSELQSLAYLVCRLLLETKKIIEKMYKGEVRRVAAHVSFELGRAE